MRKAFESLGVDLVVVDGYGRDRAREMKRVSRAIERGDRFDALYSELTTMPTMLADEHHLPTHPLADFAFLRRVKGSGAGVGVFYRDVYWRFAAYRNSTTALKRWPALAAYRAEAAALKRAVDVLFVPSVPMARFLPGWVGDPRVVALPPGSERRTLPWTPSPDGLRLVYVGSVRPPFYDMSALLDAVLANERVRITVCCPSGDAELLTRWSGSPRIDVVHEHGDSLVPLYQQADASCIVFGPQEYREFAMPIKLFESVGMGRPILAIEHDMAGQYIAAHGLGWAPRPDRLAETMNRLAVNPDEIGKAHRAVIEAQAAHTWSARCETVLDTLIERRRGAA